MVDLGEIRMTDYAGMPPQIKAKLERLVIPTRYLRGQ